MKIHEYQAKQLFCEYGIKIPRGIVVSSVSEAVSTFKKFNSKKCIVKAQIHAGGRFKADGIKIVETIEEVEEIAKNILNKKLVTEQTDTKGQIVNKLLIEQVFDVKRELYLSIAFDHFLQEVVLIASNEGGIAIEEVNEKKSKKIFKFIIDPFLKIKDYQIRELAFNLKLDLVQIEQFESIIKSLLKLFFENDLILSEINPLAITESNELICLDGKINIDDNALYRQGKLNAMSDLSQEEENGGLKAKEFGLSYVPLDGNIGCMINGAGLAMATMDLIKLFGGNPANFLDVGGDATKEKVREAFKIILFNQKITAILINIFGGIVRCDFIARGIIDAIGDEKIKLPVVVRLEGNGAQDATDLFNKSGLNIIVAKDLEDAANKVVKASFRP